MTNPVCGDCKYFWTPWCPKHGCMTSSPYDKESWKKDQQCKPCYDALANTNCIVDLRNHYDAAIKERDDAREERDEAIAARDRTITKTPWYLEYVKAESDRDAALSALATERSKCNKPTTLDRIALALEKIIENK